MFYKSDAAERRFSVHTFVRVNAPSAWREAQTPWAALGGRAVGLGLFKPRSGFEKQLGLPAGSRPSSRSLPPPPASCVSMPTASGQGSLSNVLTAATQLSKRRGNKRR